MISLPSVEGALIKGKRIFVRCDFDVPLEEKSDNLQEISDESRLVAGISTIEYLLENGAIVIAAGHIGRPGDQSQISNLKSQKFSMEPVARWFAEEFETQFEPAKIGDFDGWKIKENFIILENLRFNPGEEENDPEFAQNLANLADVYVNESFASSHRPHASIVGLPKLLPHYAGFHLQ
jgi:phosphoglycerate kinase